MKKTYNELVELIKKECKEHGAKLDIRKTSYVLLDSMQCAGYFDYDTKTPKIVVAANAKDAKATLLHEYCHLKQFIDNDKLWKKSGKATIALNEWLDGKDFDKKKIKKYISICRELELDNEKRAAKLAKKYDVDMSVSKYIKKANAHVLYYNWLAETRKWSKTDKSPYCNKRILKLMSDKFDMNYKKLDPKIRKAFKKEKI